MHMAFPVESRRSLGLSFARLVYLVNSQLHIVVIVKLVLHR